MKKKCNNCDSHCVYEARHDSDWGGGNQFSPLNENLPDIDPDIRTFYCSECGTFGDDLIGDVAE